MTSLPQDTAACTCPSCGNRFAVKTSFLGRQVTCPICAALITARQEEKHQDDTEQSSTPPPTPQPHLPPRKKTDKRNMPVHIPSRPVPAESTTKIRKRKEAENAAPAMADVRMASLAQKEPEYQPLPAEAARSKRRSSWPVWLFVSGLVLASLGMLMFLQGKSMEAESSKVLNISERFVDREALFAREEDKNLLEELQQRAKQYRLIANTRKEEDRKAESVSAHVTAAMNELALYCMAGSDEERLNYVINPTATAPKMARWASYGRYKDYLPQEAGQSSKNGDLLQISVLMDDNTVRPAVFLYDRDSGKWKLDWEAWEGYSPILPSELEANKPSTPVPVRIALSASGTYTPPFLEESSSESYRNTAYINFTLEFPNGERVNAYVDRYSPLALELIRQLYNGPVRASLLIHYPADLPGCQSVIIDKLLHSGWMSEATRRLLPANS